MATNDIDLDKVTSRPFYRYELLDCEDAISGYIEEAATEGPAGILDAVAVAAVARLINHIARATGVDRLQLCAAFDGGLSLDDAVAVRVAECAKSSLTPVAVG